MNFQIHKIIFELTKKRFEIRKIYKDGIGASFFTLRYLFPVLSIVLFYFIVKYLNLDNLKLLDLIKQMNSLIGIILGFSIASFAIFISINNQKLEEKSQNTNFTYREIGSSLFFYNVEISLLTSIIGIFLTFMIIPDLTKDTLFFLVENNKLFIISFSIYIVLFFQLIYNLFYSSIFLNSSIKKKV
ncbi:hypothetical protein [Arcobacter sp. YIC-310]|uniref:hypothetical protein n=1 Tax=Arcobacter sp. YIC-310 TaxID=3376632 RepID=UPI003C1C876C